MPVQTWKRPILNDSMIKIYAILLALKTLRFYACSLNKLAFGCIFRETAFTCLSVHAWNERHRAFLFQDYEMKEYWKKSKSNTIVLRQIINLCQVYKAGTLSAWSLAKWTLTVLTMEPSATFHVNGNNLSTLLLQHNLSREHEPREQWSLKVSSSDAFFSMCFCMFTYWSVR